MDVSSLRSKMVQAYQEELKELVSRKYRHNVNEVVLAKLDKAVATLEVEREFALMEDTLLMQLGWMKSTAGLADCLLSLCGIQTYEVALRAIDEQPEDFGQLLRKIAAMFDKQAHASTIIRELEEKKESYLDDLYWDIFRDEDHDALAVAGELSQQLCVNMAKIPGTRAYRLIEKRRELCDLFPEMREVELEWEFTRYRLDFALDKSPSQMDDFTGKIIQVVSTVLRDSSADELMTETRENIMNVLMSARRESFGGTETDGEH